MDSRREIDGRVRECPEVGVEGKDEADVLVGMFRRPRGSLCFVSLDIRRTEPGTGTLDQLYSLRMGNPIPM